MNVGKLNSYVDVATGREIPLCMNCEHFRGYTDGHACAHASARLGDPPFSLVTGRVFGRDPGEMRASKDPAHCGEGARHFEREIPVSLPPVRYDDGPGLFATPWPYLVIGAAIVVCVVEHYGGCS